MKRRWIALFLLLALLATGCAARNKSEMYAAPAAEAPMAAPMAMSEPMMDYAMEEAATDTATAAGYQSMGGDNGSMEGGALTEPTSPDYGGRKIIRTLSIELRTDRFDEHLAAILKDVETAGGYVQASYVYGTKPEVAGDSGRSASCTLRIPVEQADAFVKTASGYGTLLSQNEDTEDVTDNYFDIETRLAVYKDTLERLRGILVQTDNLADVIELEKEITRVTIEIEDLTTRLRKYDGLIDYATVRVELYEKGLKIGPAAKTPFGERISEGFAETLSDVGNFIEDFAVVLITGLPVFIPLGLLAWLVIYLINRRRDKIAANGGMTGRQRRQAKREARLAKRAEKKNAKLNAKNAMPAQSTEKEKDHEQK